MRLLIISIIIVFILATIAIALTIPQPISSAEKQITALQPSDILIISLQYDNGKLNLNSIQTTKGFSSKRIFKGDYSLEVLDGFGSKISEQSFNKPMIIYENPENQLTGALVSPEKDQINLAVEVNKNAKEFVIKEIKTNKIILKENLDWLKEA